MGGKFSRNKGRRGEQQLVLHLAKLGYKAERILRQYQFAGQPDVVARKNGKEYTFENKSLRCSFKSIYELYYSERDGDKSLRFVMNDKGVAVSMSTDFETLLVPDQRFRNLEIFPPTPKQLKAYSRIVGTIKDMKQTADFLVIKDNGESMLFIRYFG